MWARPAAMVRTALRPTVLAITLTVAACALPVTPEGSLGETPLFERMPLSVGVYYDDAFRQYAETVETGPPEEELAITLGEPSVAMFNDALGAMFQTAVPVDSRPPLADGSPPGLAGVIAPRINGMFVLCTDKKKTFSWALEGCNTRVAYGITLYSMAGHEIASLDVDGAASEDAVFEGHDLLLASTLVGAPIALNQKQKKLGRMIAAAMKAAVAEFIMEFRAQPGVEEWLARQTIASTGSGAGA